MELLFFSLFHAHLARISSCRKYPLYPIRACWITSTTVDIVCLFKDAERGDNVAVACF